MTFDGAALMRDLVPTSPYCVLLGLSVVELSDGRAVLALPFKDDVITIGRTVHGGAIASLADTAAMAAAWSGAPEPERVRGSTATLTISYLAPADAADLEAEAVVTRRGRRLVHVAVTVRAGETAVAQALVAYSLG